MVFLVAGVASAAIVSGELIIGLDDGSIIRAGYVQGPKGLTGDRGSQGSVGPKGLDGNSVLHGLGTPTMDDGRDGDFFYSTDQVAFYGPKTAGKWGKPVYLRPQDNKSFTLPTGMKSQGGGAGGRAFSASMSGPGGIPAPAASGGGDLKVITGHNKPFVSGLRTQIAQDSTGDAMKVLVWAQAATGTLFAEVAASQNEAGTDAGWSEVFDIKMGTRPPVLTFNAQAVGGVLTLYATSDIPLTSIKGRVIYL